MLHYQFQDYQFWCSVTHGDYDDKKTNTKVQAIMTMTSGVPWVSGTQARIETGAPFPDFSQNFPKW